MATTKKPAAKARGGRTRTPSEKGQAQKKKTKQTKKSKAVDASSEDSEDDTSESKVVVLDVK